MFPPNNIPPRVRFTLDEAQRAADEWNLNCGPASIAAVLGLTLENLRPHLGDFEQKGYTNPTLMWEILRNLKAPVIRVVNREPQWPAYGLARVQWEGPWTAPGVPMRVRYRHTHWVGVCSDARGWTTPGWAEPRIFDVNCMCVGGWVSLSEWSGAVVPWLVKQCEPRANGNWHLTHSVEIERPPDVPPEQ